jgi:hypothetical protein
MAVQTANDRSVSETPKTRPAADDPEALREDIAVKRRELGDTAAERDAGQQAQATVTAQASRVDPRLLGVVAVIVLLLVLRRRRR